MPTIPDTITATYADESAILARDESALRASFNVQVQHHLNQLYDRLRTLKIKVNPQKSSHITCTLGYGDSHALNTNNTPILHTNTVTL